MGGNILNKTYSILEQDKVITFRLDAIIAITFSESFKTIIFSFSNGKQVDWVLETLDDARLAHNHVLRAWEEIL